VRVVPCLAPGAAQSAHDSQAIIEHLRYNTFLDDNDIAAALISTGYKWTVGRDTVGMAMVQIRFQWESARTNNTPPAPSVGLPSRSIIIDIKLRAQELDALYRANGHNPDYQGQLLKQMVDLLYAADGGGDPPPGRGSLERERERLRQTREEILRNSPNIARVMQNLGPLALDRIRRLPPGVDGSTVRQVAPNTYRITPPRRPAR